MSQMRKDTFLSGYGILQDCQDMFYISTVFGQVLKGTSAEYKGKKYPSFLFKKGRPVPEFRRYLQIEKLFIS